MSTARSGELGARLLAAVTGRRYDVVVPPPGHGAGFWAGAPSAVLVGETMWLGYRLRRPVDHAGGGRGYANVIARSADGVRFETVHTVTSEEFGAASIERPALVALPAGGLRLYVSCSTAGSKHWWVEALELTSGARHPILPGDDASAWKDVVVHAGEDGWRMWACRHPLDGGDDEADRMTSWYATGEDGLGWTLHGAALVPRPGQWDARGTRVSSVLQVDGGWLAFYDGRASAAENWHERTGIAWGAAPDALASVGGPTPAGATTRYLSVVGLPHGYRLYWEAARPDGAHELRATYVARVGP